MTGQNFRVRRAPYRASIPVKAEMIADKLMRPWSVALLPDGRYAGGAVIALTEDDKLLRIVPK